MKVSEELRNDGPMTTEIRKLESRLWRIAVKQQLRTVLMTSALRGEGKSTTTAYLAAALALRTGRRILAIDLDFRRPTLRKYFDVEPTVGLEAVLRGENSTQAAITASDVPGLDLMLPAERPSDPSLLENLAPLREILQALGESYDLILLDAPALIPVADAGSLIPLADGVVLVAMAGLTTRHHLSRARELCLGMGANVLGLVVGNVQEAAPEYLDTHYYHGYGRDHGA